MFFLFITLNIFSQNTTDIRIKDQFGGKWFSLQNFYLINSAELGVSGVKNYFSESFLFSYRFKSRIQHAFTIRTYHLGYAPGILTNNFEYFNFGVLLGFEYLYKIFSPTEGLFFYTDIGGCQNGVAVNTGVGIGSRITNGCEMNFTFLQTVDFFSRLDFFPDR